jgi:hypothetical protein
MQIPATIPQNPADSPIYVIANPHNPDIFEFIKLNYESSFPEYNDQHSMPGLYCIGCPHPIQTPLPIQKCACQLSGSLQLLYAARLRNLRNAYRIKAFRHKRVGGFPVLVASFRYPKNMPLPGGEAAIKISLHSFCLFLYCRQVSARLN